MDSEASSMARFANATHPIGPRLRSSSVLTCAGCSLGYSRSSSRMEPESTHKAPLVAPVLSFGRRWPRVLLRGGVGATARSTGPRRSCACSRTRECARAPKPMRRHYARQCKRRATAWFEPASVAPSPGRGSELNAPLTPRRGRLRAEGAADRCIRSRDRRAARRAAPPRGRRCAA